MIVDIDETSLRKLGQWPWPRTRVAELIDRLTQHGAAAIAFDLVFAEPDRLSPGVAADTYRALDDETRAKLRALPSNDEIMAEAIKRSTVVLGETVMPVPVPQHEGQQPPLGLAYFGSAIPSHSCSTSRGCFATFQRSTTRPPAAVSSASLPSGTASYAACR